MSLKARRQNEDGDATSEGEKVRALDHDDTFAATNKRNYLRGWGGALTLLFLLKATGSSRGGFSKIKV